MAFRHKCQRLRPDHCNFQGRWYRIHRETWAWLINPEIIDIIPAAKPGGIGNSHSIAPIRRNRKVQIRIRGAVKNHTGFQAFAIVIDRNPFSFSVINLNQRIQRRLQAAGKNLENDPFPFLRLKEIRVFPAFLYSRAVRRELFQKRDARLRFLLIHSILSGEAPLTDSE